MSYGSWFLDETPLPKLGFLGQGNNGYVTLVRNGDGLLMAKKTSFVKYSEDLEKEVRIMDRFFSINFNTVRATSPAVSYETMPLNVKVCSIHMEVAPHGSLKDMLTKAGGTLPENVIGYCIFQVLEGLRDLHRDGYVHCDLKPENILIKSYKKCEVKIIDLGSSCFRSDNLSLYVQSRSYRAPEVILGLPYDEKIDLWSLGCILAELCSGEVQSSYHYKLCLYTETSNNKNSCVFQVLFPNEAVAMILARIVAVLGPIETVMLEKGQETDKYFTKEFDIYHLNEVFFYLDLTVRSKALLLESDSLWLLCWCYRRAMRLNT